MAKTGPLGKAEVFYVEEKFKAGQSAPKTIVEQQFVRQSGATIMTENASSMIDQKRLPIKKNHSNCVTKIK